MKKARDFISMSKLSYKSRLLQFGIIEEWIKQAQLNAIEETVKLCSENASMDLYDYIGTSFKKFEQDNHYSINDGTYVEVSKSSILDCAEILKKELE